MEVAGEERNMEGHSCPSTLPMFIVDAFTDKPFGGNPAAVCLVDRNHDLSEELMQSIASEMNLSETAFVRTLQKTDSFATSNRFGLRWFTPKDEVDLCGHATLGSAATLFTCIGNTSDQLVFETLSGELSAVRESGGINLELPLRDSKTQDHELYIEIMQELFGGDSHSVKQICLSHEAKKLMVRLDDSCTRKDLESIKPNFDKLTGLEDGNKFKGIIITLRGSKENGCVDAEGRQYDFVSRYFAPWHGIPEDPVTGSAHTVLGKYWAEELNSKILYARQCSCRGGELRLRVRNDGRLDLAGGATVVLRGSISV